MKVGQKITIERLEGGLYTITCPDGFEHKIGAAASTAMALNMLIFRTEAGEVKEETERVRNPRQLI
jgi:hypothetical protein